jgi:protein KRI1
VFDGTRRSVCPVYSLPLIFTVIVTEEQNKSSTAPVPARTKKKFKEDKPLTLPEQRIAAALDVASTRSSSPVDPLPLPTPTHVAEQAALRAETIAVFHSGAAVGRRGADSGDAEQEEEGGLFTLREKTKDEIEQEEAEYRAYLEREVGPLEKILDLGEEEKINAISRVEEDAHTRPDETDSGKKKRKKKAKKGAEDRKETDQEFLIK